MADLDRLVDRLRTDYPTTGLAAGEQLRRWCSDSSPSIDPGLEEFLAGAGTDVVHDSFWRRIPFGTGGVRGPVGYGPNRINRTVIGLTVQAHCDFLAEHGGRFEGLEPLVVVANDVRTFCDVGGNFKFMGENPFATVGSRSLAYLAASVYAANGFRVVMSSPDDDTAILTTPELSFVIRELRAVGGVNLSASHNPPDDNGIKVYDETGGQYLPPFDQRLSEIAAEVVAVKTRELADARSAGLVSEVPEEAVEAYRQLYLSLAARDGLASRRRTSIAFTPLGGCGLRTVGTVLERLGYDVQCPPGQGPDGTFSQIPLFAPNPEVPESTEPARIWAKAHGLRTVFSSDPDADRFGLEAIDSSGRWVHLTGNEIAAVLAYLLFLDERGPKLDGPVYETIVTSLCVSEIGNRRGAAPVRNDLLVGFKYVAQAIAELEAERKEGSDDELLAFAAEESHGYLVTARLRDKDALSAALYLAALEERLASEGRTIVDYLREVDEVVGRFGNVGRSLVMRGSAGVEQIAALMASVRESPPAAVGDLDVTEVVDHFDTERFGQFKSDTDRGARNLVVLRLPRGRITVRPSGTEPKLKFYVQTLPPTSTGEPDAQDLADRLALEFYVELTSRAGVMLSDAALRLPDVVALDRKVLFDSELVPAVVERLGDEEAGDEFLRGWLDERTGVLVPGSSPAAAVRPALEVAVQANGSPALLDRLVRLLEDGQP